MNERRVSRLRRGLRNIAINSSYEMGTRGVLLSTGVARTPAISEREERDPRHWRWAR